MGGDDGLARPSGPVTYLTYLDLMAQPSHGLPDISLLRRKVDRVAVKARAAHVAPLTRRPLPLIGIVYGMANAQFILVAGLAKLLRRGIQLRRGRCPPMGVVAQGAALRLDRRLSG